MADPIVGYVQGPRGPEGRQGPPGEQGPPGNRGPKGDRGSKGDEGNVGLTGPRGLRGFKGDQGPKGDPGSLGPNGPRGLKGDQGDVGSKGDQGPRGLQGIPGPKGEKGDSGTGSSGSVTDRQFHSSVTFMALGDSLTEGSGNNVDGLTDWNWGSGYFVPESWPMFASILSGGRLIHMGSASQGGYRIESIRDKWLPVVLKMKPDLCIVLAGQNNLSGFGDSDLAALASIYDSLIIAGIIPVLATNVPSNIGPENMRLNQWVRNQARIRQLPLVDFHKALVDPLTGVYKTGWTSDGTHPETDARIAMGEAVAEALLPFYSSGTPNLADANIDNGLIAPNPLMIREDGTSGRPSGWYDMSGGAGVFTIGSDPGIVGRQLIASSNGGPAGIGLDFNVPDGHLLSISFAMDLDPAGGAGHLGPINPGWSHGYLFNYQWNRPIKGVFQWLAEVSPVNAAGGGDAFHFLLDPGSAPGAYAKISQFTVIDLTVVGE